MEVHEDIEDLSDKQEGDAGCSTTIDASSDAGNQEERDVDSVIQQAAAKTNLSVLNVKSILHHVLKDKRVLAVVQRRAAEEEGREPRPLEDDVIFEPKLTRSRVREAVASSVASGAMSPEKIAKMRAITQSPTKTGSMSAEELLNQSMPTDESSDEEYDPAREAGLSGDESEESEREENTSEMDVTLCGLDTEEQELTPPKKDSQEEPARTSSPTSATPTGTHSSVPVPANESPDERSEEAIVKETAALLASLSDVILSPIKSVRSSSEQGQSSLEGEVPHEEQYYGYSEQLCPLKEGEIAKRTRSKYPLNDTPLSVIEESFHPPDADDPRTPLELDDDDKEWHQWLNDLMNPIESQPINVSHDEGEDDVEYNYLAEQDVVEKEELRNDRAVKIPRKEVDELLNELLYPPGDGLNGLLSTDGVDLTSVYLLESLGLQSPLLSQSGQTTPLPLVGGDNSAITTPTRPAEDIGCYLSEDQAKVLSQQIRQHFQLLMQTFVLSRFEPSLVFLSQVAAQAVNEISTWSEEAEQGKNSAVWFVPDVREGMELIQQLDPNNEQAVTMTTTPSNRIPEGAQDTLMTSLLFWTHPHLLPAVGFSAISKDKSTGSSFFTNEEDCLLVLGMDHYGPVAWQPIKNNLLPTKTVKQLQLRVKNQNSKRTGDNIIKHYKKTKVLKIPFLKGDSAGEKEPKPKELPQWILQYHKKRLDREKEDRKRKEELAKETVKLKKMLGGLITQQTTQLKPVPDLGSKRNLMKTLDEVTDSTAKRSRVATPSSAMNKKQSVRKRKTKSGRGLTNEVKTVMAQSVKDERIVSSCGSPYTSVEQLLLAAGLKPSDSSARFAYSYLNEVKRTLPTDGKKYSQFLEVLVSADKKQLRVSKIFEEVQLVLEPWPHLVKLFTELLGDEDCLEADLVGDKFEVRNIKLFAEKLKERFAGSPLGLQEILDKMETLDTPSITAAKVEEAILPLILAHRDLVSSLRNFLHQLIPPPVAGECYEEVDLTDITASQPDDFELISNSTMMAALEKDKQQTKTEPSILKDTFDSLSAHKDFTAPSDVPQPDNASGYANETDTTLTETSSDCKQTVTMVTDESPPTNRSTADQCVLLDSVGKAPVTDTLTDCRGENATEAKDGTLKSSTTWTRGEDGLILKRCLKTECDQSDSIFKEVAVAISRTAEEVKSRYNELLSLLHSSKTQT